MISDDDIMECPDCEQEYERIEGSTCPDCGKWFCDECLEEHDDCPGDEDED